MHPKAERADVDMDRKTGKPSDGNQIADSPEWVSGCGLSPADVSCRQRVFVCGEQRNTRTE